jgi:hypothetical protein
MLMLYILARIGRYLYKPYALKKIMEDNDNKYEMLLSILRSRIESTVNDLEKWKSGERASFVLSSEDELKKAIGDAHDEKEHFVNVNEKYIRLKERYINDRKTLTEAILSYNRHLQLRLKLNSDAELYTKLLELDGITFDEWIAKGNETKIMIEESERRLDVLLQN